MGILTLEGEPYRWRQGHAALAFRGSEETIENAKIPGLLAQAIVDHSGRMDDISFFATTSRHRRLFGIRQADRRGHMYIVGKTGSGKTTMLHTLASQDIAAGRGLALLDPHGDLVERLVREIPQERQHELIYFNVPDAAHPMAFNPLEHVPVDKRYVAASGMLQAFKKLWPDFWGPRMEYILRNCLFTLVYQPEATLADVLRLLNDKPYRHEALAHLENERLRNFWLKEFEEYGRSFRTEAIAPIQNKVGAFLSDPVLHAILTPARSAFDLREVMDGGKILLVNLAKGRLGEDSASLLGSLLVSRLELAALSRAELAPESRRDFFVYLDEFYAFATLSMAAMLAELRKYRVNLTLAHQYLAQLQPEIRDAVLGNVGTIVTFRIGAGDVPLLAKEFAPELEPSDLMRLPNYSVALRLMIDGAPTRPFTAQTVTIDEVLAA